MRGFLLVLAALALGGCKPKDLVTGSPEPPTSFGPLAKSSGCPKLAGAYEWPAVEGSPQGYAEGGIPDIHQGPDFFGSHAQWRGEFRIDEPTDANRQRLSINSTPHGKVSARYLDNQHRCSDGWRWLAEQQHSEASAFRGGPPVYLRVKLATLANGDLAVGQALRVDGGKYSLFRWGDSGSGGDWIPAADKVTWHWSRYRRVNP